jgi:hypothetical protein
VDRRRDDVGGRLVGELEHPLPEVCLDDVDAVARERLVQLHLLGGRRLGLHGPVGVRVGGHLPDDARRLGGVRGAVDRPAVRLDGRLQLVEELRQALDRVLLDRSCLLGQGVVVVERARLLAAAGVEVGRVRLHRRPLRREQAADLRRAVGAAHGSLTSSTRRTATSRGPCAP